MDDICPGDEEDEGTILQLGTNLHSSPYKVRSFSSAAPPVLLRIGQDSIDLDRCFYLLLFHKLPLSKARGKEAEDEEKTFGWVSADIDFYL